MAKKNKIFSGRPLSARSRASIELHKINRELKSVGLEPIKPGGSSLAKFQAAQEKAEKAIADYQKEQERKKREEEERRKREEERRAERISRYKEFLDLGGGLHALYTVLNSEDAAALRLYDSGDQLSIGEMLLENPNFESIEDAASAYYAQKENAFDEMASGDYDADFSGVPFF